MTGAVPPHADLIRRLFEIGAIRFGEFTLSQCFDEGERTGLVAPALVRQSREFLQATRFA